MVTAKGRGFLRLEESKNHSYLKKEDPRNYRTIILTSVPRKVMEKILLGSIFKHKKDKKVIWNSQNRFTKG